MFSYTISFPNEDFKRLYKEQDDAWKSCFRKVNESYGNKKKEQRLAPTFVNLKSNTMKNTMQRYALL